MISALDFETVLDTLAERLAAKLAGRLPDAPSCTVRPRLLSVEGAARYLSRTPSAIRNMITTNKLKPVRLDGRVYLDVADLDRMIEGAKEA